MAPGRNSYSRFVAWAKVLLPLLALALLATLFLVARNIDPEAALPYARVDVETLARQPQVGAPEISGVTVDGTLVTIAAAVARPEEQGVGRIVVEEVSARFASPDGSSVDLTAPRATVDGTAELAEMSGGTRIVTSSGYRLEADTLVARFGRTEIVSDGPILAEGPPGRIEAAAMRIAETGPDSGVYELVFTGGVKLVYEPGN